MTLTVALQNAGAQPVSGEMSVRYGRAVDPSTEEKGSFFGGVGNQWKATCRVAEKVQRLVPNDKPPPEFKGPIEFFGVDQQYFLAAVVPQVDQREGRCVLYATGTERSVTSYFPLTVAAGQTVTRNFSVYLGPKVSERLAEISAPVQAAATNAAGATPHLDSAVEFGWLVVICKVLLAILKFFYGVFRNWGVAIIFLTILVKLVLLPLTYRQMVSAEQMKKLQPKIDEIRKKWADDRERQNLETMKVYQEAKVNPLGGCFPLLVQMPVWFALFTTLRNSFEIYREPFIAPLWADLTYKDPTYVLPLALGVTMILTQRLQPQVGMDPTQAKLMTYVMPAFFSLLMLNYPAGLALYIFTNNLLTIAQTYGIKRLIRRRGG
jgi:YidC/Oxa1 family membrane protein insertase